MTHIILAVLTVLIILYIFSIFIRIFYPPLTCPTGTDPVYPSIWAPDWAFGSYIRPIGCTEYNYY